MFILILGELMINKKDNKKYKLKLISNNKNDFKVPRQKEQSITPKQSMFATLIAEKNMTLTDAYK